MFCGDGPTLFDNKNGAAHLQVLDGFDQDGVEVVSEDDDDNDNEVDGHDI